MANMKSNGGLIDFFAVSDTLYEAMQYACAYFSDALGDCPAGRELVDSDEWKCDEICSDRAEVGCWFLYFIRLAKRKVENHG